MSTDTLGVGSPECNVHPGDISYKLAQMLLLQHHGHGRECFPFLVSLARALREKQ